MPVFSFHHRQSLWCTQFIYCLSFVFQLWLHDRAWATQTCQSDLRRIGVVCSLNASWVWVINMRLPAALLMPRRPQMFHCRWGLLSILSHLQQPSIPFTFFPTLTRFFQPSISTVVFWVVEWRWLAGSCGVVGDGCGLSSDFVSLSWLATHRPQTPPNFVVEAVYSCSFNARSRAKRSAIVYCLPVTWKYFGSVDPKSSLWGP